MIFRQLFRRTLQHGCRGDVRIQASIYDGDGLLLDTFQQTSSVEADPAEPGVDQGQVKETRKGAVKLVSWTTSDGDAAALEVEMTDSATGETVLYTVDDTPILTERGARVDLGGRVREAAPPTQMGAAWGPARW